MESLLNHSLKAISADDGTERRNMESRIALIGIFIEDQAVSAELNRVLHDFAPYIIGRMGIPYKEKNVSIISLVIDADNDVISSLSGKLGMLRGIHVKTMYSRK